MDGTGGIPSQALLTTMMMGALPVGTFLPASLQHSNNPPCAGEIEFGLLQGQIVLIFPFLIIVQGFT